MSRALRLSETKMRKAAQIAKAEGVAVRLGKDGSITLIPDILSLTGVDQGIEGDLDAELAAFEARHGEG